MSLWLMNPEILLSAPAAKDQEYAQARLPNTPPSQMQLHPSFHPLIQYRFTGQLQAHVPFLSIPFGVVGEPTIAPYWNLA